MYQLLVYYPDDRKPRAVIAVETARALLERIPEILAEHHACLRVEVMMGTTKLFAVDCAGNRLP